MRLAAFLIALFALAACGIDGPPSPPASGQVSGEARIGVVGNM